jgi:integrase
MAAEKLSPALLQKLKPPPEGFIEKWDTVVPGLSLRVFASGRRTWTFRYVPKKGGARRRIGIGGFPAVGLAEARDRARRCSNRVSDHKDPQGELQLNRAAPTLNELIQRYLQEEVRPRKKARTCTLYAYYLEKLVGPSLGASKALEVTPSDVDVLHRKLGKKTKSQANRVITTLSGVYAFAERRRLIEKGVNPARGIEKFKERSRERYLSTDELGRLGQAIRIGETVGLPWPDKPGAASKHERKLENRVSVLSPYVAAAFRLLLFTGCRLREILHLRWNEIDFERGLLFLPDSKTEKKVVVLNAPALEMLASLPKVGDFVILGDHLKKPRSDLQRPWDLVRFSAGLEGVRIHDLRHTHASVGAGAGLGLQIIGKLLGHKHADTTARYAHLADDPLKKASSRIGTAIAAALDGNAAVADNVVDMHR